MKNGGKIIALFERQEFGDIDVDNFMNFREVLFVDEGVVKTAFKILKVEKHSFN